MGRGEDQTTNVVAGGCCAICCGICFLVLGLPMLIAGIVMVKLYEGDYDDQINQAISEDTTWDQYDNDNLDEAKDVLYKVGIALIVIAVICVVIGIVMVVVLCTGCCGRVNRGGAPAQATVTQQYVIAQPQSYPPGQQGYAPPPQGYPPAQQGYAPTQQGGYYPQGQQEPPSYDQQIKA